MPALEYDKVREDIDELKETKALAALIHPAIVFPSCKKHQVF